MNRLRLILSAVIFCATEICQASATNDFFAQGIALSRMGKLPEAAAAFQSAEQEQPAVGTLVNLGIAEWRRGHVGAAILAWERACWIDPFDSRADSNLKFARQVAQLNAPALQWFETASTWLPPDAWAWIAGASLWLAVGSMTLPGILRWRKTGWPQALAALAAGLFLFSMTANCGVTSRTQIGFVVVNNASLRLTPTREGEVISVLLAGEPARKLRTRGNYLFIRTAMAAGWIEREQFGLVCGETSFPRLMK